jgi:two-component system CheB/CheR fusion protein
MKKKVSISKNKDLNGKPFPIVAIGASAGGLEAASELFKQIPSDTGMAYVYIQHLDRDYKSRLAEIMSKTASISVEQVKNNVQVERNKLYIIPPNKDMLLAKGLLKLSSRIRSSNLICRSMLFFHRWQNTNAKDPSGSYYRGRRMMEPPG